MDVELSLTNAQAKSRALATLTELGYRAESGPVRLAYPFAIVVLDVPDSDEQKVVRLVSRVDPCVGRIAVVAQGG